MRFQMIKIKNRFSCCYSPSEHSHEGLWVFESFTIAQVAVVLLSSHSIICIFPFVQLITLLCVFLFFYNRNLLGFVIFQTIEKNLMYPGVFTRFHISKKGIFLHSCLSYFKF